MRKIRGAQVLGLLLLSLALASCAGYTEMGARTTAHQDMSGGNLTARISKANGTAHRRIEMEGRGGREIEVDVTLAVGKGTYKIELLGEDDQVTLALEASDGQTVSGHGQMVVDSLGEAHYQITALEAEDVSYAIEYAYR
jgi:hypothetical protein